MPAPTTAFSARRAAQPGGHDGFDLLDDCHERIHLALGQLAALIHQLDGAGPGAEARALAAQIVSFFSETVRQHHQDEERHVFPQLLASGDADLVHEVERLQQDHRWLEVDWMELQPLLSAVAAGQSFSDLETLRATADVFAALLRDHIALEESIVYPQARAQLRGPARMEMGREMAARRHAERGTPGKGAGGRVG